ncbi:MAG: flagella basal body P-ring formation protein FlgA [Spirochaetota bacterium]
MSFSMAHAQNKTELNLKSTFAATKSPICLSDIVETHTLSPREAEKLTRYCRIEFKGARMTLSAKDIELHAWAAGITPDKISGGPVTISMATSLQLPAAGQTAAPAKLRRGSAVQLVIKSENMTIAREAALLADSYTGETVEVRPAGTRKTLRAKLVSNSVAELTP